MITRKDVNKELNDFIFPCENCINKHSCPSEIQETRQINQGGYCFYYEPEIRNKEYE